MKKLSLSVKHLLISIVLTGLIGVVPVVHASDLIDPFVGVYDGHATFLQGGHEVKRDLGVEISRTKTGFNVTWEVTTHKPSGGYKTKKYSINFRATKRKYVFAAQMKKNIFGSMDPLDPMKGEPYVWARIKGDTLTVFALLINEDGGYELQIYDRSLAEKGLDLKYSRIRNGQQLRTINAFLSER